MGTRVPRNTHAPLTRLGSHSAAEHVDQSIMIVSLPPPPISRRTPTTARTKLRPERQRRPQFGVGGRGRIRQFVLFCLFGGSGELSKLHYGDALPFTPISTDLNFHPFFWVDHA
jgi:hypothetical protein